MSVLSLSYLGFKFYLYWIFLSQSVFYIFVWKNVKCEKFDKNWTEQRPDVHNKQTHALYNAGPGLYWSTVVVVVVVVVVI